MSKRTREEDQKGDNNSTTESVAKRLKVTASPSTNAPQKTVFVVYNFSHVDCYKRSESGAEVVGVFDNYEAACRLAVDKQFNTEDESVLRFIMTKIETCAFVGLKWSDVWGFNVNSFMENQTGEYTMQVNGEFYSIKEFKVQSSYGEVNTENNEQHELKSRNTEDCSTETSHFPYIQYVSACEYSVPSTKDFKPYDYLFDLKRHIVHYLNTR